MNQPSLPTEEITLSVIVPCYNGGRYLSEALASLDGIQGVSYEVIIINDGSTEPETLKIIAKLDKDKYTVINQENQGLPKTRNIGIRASRGRYILPLDDDNLITAEYVYKSLAFLDSHPEYGIVYSDRKDFGLVNKIAVLPDFSIDRLISKNYIDACAIYRREVWEICNGYDENLFAFEDWEFWLNAYSRGVKFHHLPEALFYYRFKGTDASLNVQGHNDQNFAGLLSYIYAKYPLIVRNTLENSSLLEQNDDYQREIRQLTATISNMERSLTWRLLIKLDKSLDQLLGTDTAGRKNYQQIIAWLQTTSLESLATGNFNNLTELIKRAWRNIRLLSDKLRFKALPENYKIRLLILGPEQYPAVYIYRCLNLKEQLNLAGYHFIDCHYYNHLPGASDLNNYDLIILHRPDPNPAFDAWFRLCLKLNKTMIFATDDLISDHKIEAYLELEKRLTPADLAGCHNYIDAIKKIISQCHGLIVATPYLGQAMKEFNLPIFILPNRINKKHLKITRELLEIKNTQPSNNNVIIGYFSGTRFDHDHDFEIILEPLAKILDKHKNVIIRIVGYLKINQQFLNKYSSRLEFIGFAPFYGLPALVADTNINIAPLADNPQKRAKSPAKVFEAGLVGVPTVASNLETYALVINNGQDGYLCDDNDNWFKALDELIANVEKRRKIAESARQKTIISHLTNTNLAEVKIIFETIGKIKPYQKKKILFINHQESRTGAPVLLKMLIDKLSASIEFDCHVLSLDLTDDSWTYPFLFRLNDLPGSSKIEKVNGLAELLKPDLVFANTVMSIETALSFKCPKIILLHEFKSLYANYYNLKKLKEFNKVLALNYGAVKLLEQYGIKAEKISQYIELDLPAINPVIIKDSFICIGSVLYRKGLDRFIRLAQKMPAQNFIWVGNTNHVKINGNFIEYDEINFVSDDYKPGEKLTGVIRRLTIPTNVTFAGLEKETAIIADWLPKAKVLLILSYDDPYPLVASYAKMLNVNVVNLKEAGDSYQLADQNDLVLDKYDEEKIIAYLNDLQPNKTIINRALQEVIRANYREYLKIIKDILAIK